MVFNLQESEKEVQDSFINLLKNQGYDYIQITDEEGLFSNFKKQLELFNHKSIDNFDEIISYLCEDSSYDTFDKLRNTYRDIKFIDFSDFSNNIFQVTQEINVQGEYLNRYDVTILINGLPLVQIELKKSNVNLQEAFGQITRYSNHSYSNLFDYIQLFVISNKVHTRYFFNDSTFDYNSTYVWEDSKDLESFTVNFLDKNNLLNVISNYIFRDLISNEVKMFRPYQIEVVNNVLAQIDKNENAYVWMSYNTGKTLTSLRLAQILKEKYKVIYLTTNHLSKYPSEFVVKNKDRLFRKLKRKNLVITNIRSLLSLKDDLDKIKDDKIIFILNEYEKFNVKYDPLILKNKFINSLFYCFTSAPIFDDNIIDDETTKFIFDNKIYAYSLKDALIDKTNLDLEVEYVSDESIGSDYNFSSQSRIKEISNYILETFADKTFDGKFKSIVFTSSNRDLVEYYLNLETSNLKIAPILRYNTNDIYLDKPILDYFEKFFSDYNQRFGADIEYKKVVDTSKLSDALEDDIIKRFNNGEIDLLLIDESMLTNKYKLNLLGNLKNPQLNTIYLDCDLKYESLFEVLTMVNELSSTYKTCGNIVTFRDIRNNINDAVKLFSNNQASENYELKSYEYYLDAYNEVLNRIGNTNDFITTYEILSRNYHILERFDDFELDKSQIDEFNKYKDEYEHEKFRLESSKKIIPKFKLSTIDQYTINLSYIDDLLEGKIKNNEKSSEKTNLVLNNTNQNFNDNSKEINITDSSKNVNINELHIHINNQNKDEFINTNLADNSREKLAIPIENHQINETIMENNESGPQTDEGIFEIQKEDFIVTIDEGDLIENLKYKLKEVNLAPENTKIMAKECNYCGKRYDINANFCYNDPGVELINSHDFKKVCPQCGMKYPKKANYCNEHPNVKLEDINNFPKICPKCGRRYDDYTNFCQEDVGVKLITEHDFVKYCPNCGAKYPKEEYRCSRCDSNSELKDIEKINIKTIEFSPNEYYNVKSHENSIEDLADFFTSENITKLNTFTFTQKDYDAILKNIINTHELIVNKLIEDYDIDFEKLSSLEKMLLYAKAFVKVKYKSSGPELGKFIFNHIYLDDRKPGAALEITTIIHELSHFLISEILEQIIMEVLDTYKSNVIEAFVCYILVKDDFNNLLDEFSAHSVESKYTMYGFQDFSSYKSIYNKIIASNQYDAEDIEIARIIGNSFANDIKIIFEAIIDENLREDILDEFKTMSNPNYEDLSFEIDKTLTFDDFLRIVRSMIIDVIDNIQPNEIDKLQSFIVEFEKNND